MFNFKKYIILKEAIEESDIIDLYIMMSMPDITSDDAYEYEVKENKNKIYNNITSEIEDIFYREIYHMWYRSHECIALRSGHSHYKDIDLIKLFSEIFNYDFESLGDLSNKLKLIHMIKESESFFDKEIRFSDVEQYSGLNFNIDIVIDLFEQLHWYTEYGGKNWANAAKHAKKLLQSPPDKILYQLDRFIDFVHNTGSFANKFKGYDQGWLYFILDLKAYALNIRELIPYASYDVQKLFRSQEWRMALMNQPGKGASESFTAEIGMLDTYMKNLTHLAKNNIILLRSYAHGEKIPNWNRTYLGLDYFMKNFPLTKKIVHEIIQNDLPIKTVLKNYIDEICNFDKENVQPFIHGTAITFNRSIENNNKIIYFNAYSIPQYQKDFWKNFLNLLKHEFIDSNEKIYFIFN